MKMLFAVLLLLVTPCLATPESIEGFTFGTSGDEVVQRIGEPTSIEGPEYHQAGRVWVWSWDYPRYGAIFEVQAPSQDAPKKVRSITVVAPSAWKLETGIGIGDNTDKILTSYGNVNRFQDSLWFAQALDKSTLTGFELKGSRIKSIYISSGRK